MEKGSGEGWWGRVGGEGWWRKLGREGWMEDGS